LELPILNYGQTVRLTCPFCTNQRRKTKSKDLSVTRKSDGATTYFCHHCGVSGVQQEKKLSAVPSPVITKSPLKESHYEYLKTRGISRETADKMKLFSAEKWFARLNRKTQAVGFPYYRNGALTAAKYRSIEDKDFIQDGGGAHDLFGIDNVDTSLPLIIVEGEIDALSLIECGVPNAVSVPGGAPLKVSEGKIHPSEDGRFSFIWNANDIIQAVPSVIIATDNDVPGHALAEEIARRVGKDKCKLVKLSHKDLNEVLLKDGAEEVQRIIDEATPYPVAGLSPAADFEERLNDLWFKGTGKGASTGYPALDIIYTVVPGQLTVVTGYPSSGKSNFVDQLMVNLGKSEDWKFALCSFENAPEIHISRLMEIYKEKRFFSGNNRMSDDERKEAFKWVDDHFSFLTSESAEPATIDSILARLKVAVSRSGIRGAVIDPYNYIETSRESSETESISNMLTKIQAFAKSYGVHIWFVAHPSKMQRSGNDLPRPDGMAISGSMAWWAKADVGLTIHRLEHHTELVVWKCRYRWVGTQGECKMEFQKDSGTYKELTDDF
jgi:twinkle protein